MPSSVTTISHVAGIDGSGRLWPWVLPPAARQMLAAEMMLDHVLLLYPQVRDVEHLQRRLVDLLANPPRMKQAARKVLNIVQIAVENHNLLFTDLDKAFTGLKPVTKIGVMAVAGSVGGGFHSTRYALRPEVYALYHLIVFASGRLTGVEADYFSASGHFKVVEQTPSILAEIFRRVAFIENSAMLTS